MTVNHHPTYLHLLAALPHDIWNLAPLAGRAGEHRLQPVAGQPTRQPPATRTGMADVGPDFFDVALVHRVTDLGTLGDFANRRLMLLLHPPSRQQQLESTCRDRTGFLAHFIECLEMAEAEVVFSSQGVADSWPGLAGTVIVPGIPLAGYGGYHGRQPAVLWVTDQVPGMAARPGPRHSEVLHGIPKQVVHRHLTAAGAWVLAGREAADRRALLNAYRAHRCLCVMRQPGVAEDHEPELLAAMATGMPVVTTPDITSFVIHGSNGLVGHSASELRRHLVRLLHQPELARQLGCQARRTVARLFPHDRFVSAWEELLAVRPGPGSLYPPRTGQPGIRVPARLNLIRGEGTGVKTTTTAGVPPQLTVIEGGLPA